MSKTRNKNRSEIEYLSGEIRKLKKENKQLRRLLEKQSPAQDEESLPADSEDTHPKMYTEIKYCSECGKGKLRTFEIIGRFFVECDTCDYRKKIDG